MFLREGKPYHCPNSAKRQEWASWLEKQGEQKPAIIIQKFRVGDEIKTNNEESLTITKIDEKGYWSDDLFICSFEDSAKWELIEQKPAWSEENEHWRQKAIDFMKHPDLIKATPTLAKDTIDWLKSLKDRVQPKQEWSEEDEKHYQGCLNLMKLSLGTKPYPYYNDYLWLKSLKGKVQPKQEWSEEDDNKINSIKYLLHELDNHNFDNWLKSLKDRVQPKQEWSEEDENMVRYVGNAITCEKSAKYLEEKGVDMIKAHRWLESIKQRIGE